MTTRFHEAFRLIAAATGLLMVLQVPPAHAGKLDSFENSARTTTRPPSHTDHESHALSADDACLSDLFSEFFFQAFVTVGAGIGAGGVASVERLSPGIDAFALSDRRMGEPLIPYLAIEPAWQMLNSDVEAWDLQAEVGMGPVSILGRYTQFREEVPDDRMSLSRASVLYRMSVGDVMEVDLGFGVMFLDGEEAFHRFSFSMPIRVHPGGPLGLEFRPAWSENLADYDVSLYITVGNVSLKGGYRWLNAPEESLNGPYVGLSMRL